MIQEAEQRKTVLYFMDAAHFVLGSNLSYLWSFVRCFILTSAGRQRHNILAALNYCSKEILSISNDNYINSQSVCDLLALIKEKSINLPIKIILDTAKYQHCQYVLDCARELGIELVFLPTYSPNFNLIERLWKFVRKKALYSKYYSDFNKFKMGIHEVLDNLDTYKKEINSLMSPKFQSFKNVHIVRV
jgi:transposase